MSDEQFDNLGEAVSKLMEARNRISGIKINAENQEKISDLKQSVTEICDVVDYLIQNKI